MRLKQCTEIPENSASLLILRVSEGILVIQVKEIIRIESVSNYSRLYLSNGRKITVARILHWFEEQKMLSHFIRIHRTHLVNPQYVKNITGRGKKIVQLHSGEVFPVARRRKALLLLEIMRLNNPAETISASAKNLIIKKSIAA